MTKPITTSLLLILLILIQVKAQDVQNSRRMSQKATTTQRIGTTDITIEYHRPSANGREIFGGIVPYDFVVDGKEYAWRAGANNRTTIEFNHDLTVEGQSIPAGKYGLVVLVSEKDWTFVFSSDMSWGSFQYDPKNDVLRVKVPVESTPYQDWLSYDFVELKAESADVELRWVGTKARITLATDVTQNILTDLTQKEDKTSDDYRTLAIETLKQDPSKLNEALEYVELSFPKLDEVEERRRQGEEFASNILKADLLIKLGSNKEGKKLRKQTLETSEGFNIYGYALNMLMVKNNKEEALKLLKDNVKRNPEQWQGHLAFGEYYLKDGNQEKAVEHFKKAYEFAPEVWKNYARYLYLQNRLILERT